MSDCEQYAIIAQNICFSYEKFTKDSSTLNSVSLNIAKGEIYGIIGPSGCGKTTLIKTIIGLLKPKRGEISVFGFKPGSAESGTPGIGVGYMPQEISLPTLFKVKEVFKYFGNIYLLNNDTIEIQMKYFMNTFDLSDENEMIRNLSGGQMRRISLAIALFSYPRLLILDEPSVGVDPLLRQTIWSFLTNLTRERNTTVVVTTHYIEEMRCAKAVAFMRNGEILLEAEPSNVIQQNNCLNLEEAFLKLCRQGKDARSLCLITSNENKKSTNAGNIQCSIIEPLKNDRISNQFLLNLKILKAIVMKIWISCFRHGGPALAFFLPIIASILLINCVGTYPKHVRLGYVVEDLISEANVTIEETPFLPNILLDCIYKSKVFQIVKYNTTHEALKDAKRLKISGYIHLKRNFSESFYERDIFLNEGNDYITNDIIDTGSIHASVEATIRPLFQLYERKLSELTRLFREEAYAAIGVNRNVSLDTFKLGEAIHESVERENYSQYTHNIVISVLVVSYFGFSVAATAITLQMDTKDAICGRSFAAGVKPYMLIFSEIIMQFLIMASSAIINLLILIWAFKVPCKGSLLLAVTNVLLQTLAGLSLGTLVGVTMKTPFNCHIAIYGLLIDATILSDTIYTTQASPYFVKLLLPFSPCYFQVKTMLKIFNYSYCDFVTQVLPSFASSTCYALISCLIACCVIKSSP